MSNEQPERTPAYQIYKNECIGREKKLYLNTKTGDVHFLFGTKDNANAQVAAHKCILAATSDVFEAMFYGEIKEKGNVHVPDTTEAAFMEFLQYFYLSEVKLSAEHIEAVLYLGQKYNVKKCVADCVQFLVKFLNNENVCSRLHLAILYEQPELVKICEKQLLVNTPAVFKSLGFLACDRQVLAHILKMNQLSCSEVEVFEAMMAWVKAKSKQDVLSKELVELHLGDLFYEIRFASMKIEDFCALANKYDAVLSSYYRTITNVIAHVNFGTGDFNTLPRHIEWNEDAIIKCDRVFGIESFAYNLDTIENIIFSSNEPLLLGRLTCSKIVLFNETSQNFEDLRSDLMVEVTISKSLGLNSKEKGGNIILKMQAKLRSESTDISLSQPILIHPGIFYKIEIGPFAKNHYCHFLNSKKRVDLAPDGRIVFHDGYIDDCYTFLVAEIICSLDFNRI